MMAIGSTLADRISWLPVQLEEIFNESLSQPPDPSYLMAVYLQGQYLESSKIIPHCQTSSLDLECLLPIRTDT
jgi:hypothetical protein